MELAQGHLPPSRVVRAVMGPSAKTPARPATGESSTYIDSAALLCAQRPFAPVSAVDATY
ncbi:hypothetical protein PC123_g8988 [Phytophthora cactorum]|nr:hypothetical protein PC120_g9537 [Phytophthora cactorum]KAG4055949.1 hypothetical protein PC123_g8988 [Phytophthora cactorum]